MQFEGLDPEEDVEVKFRMQFCIGGTLEIYLKYALKHFLPPRQTPTRPSTNTSPSLSMQIPGTYRDAMTSNTPLGKAIKEACSELDNLAALEKETLTEADALLKKLGLKSSLFDVPEAKSNDNE